MLSVHFSHSHEEQRVLMILLSFISRMLPDRSLHELEQPLAYTCSMDLLCRFLKLFNIFQIQLEIVSLPFYYELLNCRLVNYNFHKTLRAESGRKKKKKKNQEPLSLYKWQFFHTKLLAAFSILTLTIFSALEIRALACRVVPCLLKLRAIM